MVDPSPTLSLISFISFRNSARARIRAASVRPFRAISISPSISSRRVHSFVSTVSAATSGLSRLRRTSTTRRARGSTTKGAFGASGGRSAAAKRGVTATAKGAFSGWSFFRSSGISRSASGGYRTHR